MDGLEVVALGLDGDQSIEGKLSICFNEGSCYLALASYSRCDVEDFGLLQAMTVFLELCLVNVTIIAKAT